MALPAQITTCNIVVGSLLDFGGDPYTFKVEWQAVLDGKPLAGTVRSIVWEATGQALASFVEKPPPASTGGTVTFAAPHVDQAGFIDGSGNAVTNWTYRVKMTARSADRKTYTKTKLIQPLVGQTSIDFDFVDDGTTVLPVSTPTARVTSVNGDTGPIVVPTFEDLADKQPLSDELTAFAALSPANTQLPSWSTVLGEWTATNPVGLGLNAGSANTTSTPTAASSASALGTVVAVPGTSISVTNSGGRPVILVFDAALVQSVVGTGSVWLVIAETTSGTTYRRYNIKPLPNSTAAAFATMTFGLAICPIGAVTTTRTFDIRAAVYQGTGSPAVNIINSPTHPTALYAINL